MIHPKISWASLQNIPLFVRCVFTSPKTRTMRKRWAKYLELKYWGRVSSWWRCLFPKSEIAGYLAILSWCRHTYSGLIVSLIAFFSVIGKFPGEEGIVAPGMSCQYNIRFMPDALMDFEDELTVSTQSSQPITVKLLGKRPPPLLTCKYGILKTLIRARCTKLTIDCNFNFHQW